MTDAREVLRIGNCSGFYGDRLAAAREMVEGGPIDVLTGDYLAELTMLILWKSRQRDPAAGYATTFLTQMEQVLGTCLDRGIKVVSNAGGLNPSGLAAELGRLAERLGLHPSIAYVDGDDLLGRIPALQRDGESLAHLGTGQSLAEAGVEPVTANAYLGGWGIAAALDAGADVVVCPRVTDASLVVGPAAWAFGWKPDDWDRLAGAVVAGHVIECGPQATGGNYSFFTELGDSGGLPGYPIAEVFDDGSSVITKHPGTGGAVTVETVTAQVLYETASPDYLNPDVIARFDTIELSQEAPDRVRIGGVRGLPAPETTKVCLNYHGGFRNSATFILTGLDIEAKAEHTVRALDEALGGLDTFAEADVRLLRTDTPDAPASTEAEARLRITLKDADETRVGRRFFNAIGDFGMSGYPGMWIERAERSASAYGVYWPTLVPAEVLRPEVVLADGRRLPVPAPPTTPYRGYQGPLEEPRTSVAAEDEETVLAPLGRLAGARSGDKGGNANIGLWARTDAGYAWLREHLDVPMLRLLLTEAADLEIDRFELPNLRAINFVVHGLLGDGVAATTRPDPQAKGLGEYVRSRYLEIPQALLPAPAGATTGATIGDRQEVAAR
ncbi:MAG: DUF1446 domain-containing protein [Nocardioidaceae bacterium]|nr:DUF1446 domain-containing protein [Nocardioidaceae bacterium]